MGKTDKEKEQIRGYIMTILYIVAIVAFVGSVLYSMNATIKSFS